jgi:Meiotically up-regulated gene 113
MAEVTVPPWPGRYLYILGSSRDGPIKIGTSQQPFARLWELQTGSPRPLTIYWVYPCPHGDVVERTMHRVLWSRHLRGGEWFDVPVEDAIAALWIAAQDDGVVPMTDKDLRDWRWQVGLILPGEGAGLLEGARRIMHDNADGCGDG